LNRPDKRNAINESLMDALRAELELVATDTSTRCVVLRGAGRGFSAGADISGPRTTPSADKRYAGSELVDLLESLPQPTVAALHGFCFTGALELALGCDLIVGTDTLQIGDTHGRYGLVPVWGGTVRLPERIGVARAKQLIFSSRPLSGTEAERIGLLNFVWGESIFDAELDRLTGEISANSPGAASRVKRLFSLGRPERTALLALERTRPWGLPEDAEERRAAFANRPKA
jgi:enoyl-CoA hydratase/carnithine racemase